MKRKESLFKNININCIYLDEDRGFIYAGDTFGFIYILSLIDLKILKTIKVSNGIIQNITGNNKFISFLSLDNYVGIFELILDLRNEVSVLLFNLGDVSTDEYEDIISVSQCLALHPYKNEIISRSSNGSLLFLMFNNEKIEFKNFLRVFKLNDVTSARFIKGGDYLIIGSNNGSVAVINNYKIIRIFALDDVGETIHWFHEMNCGKIAIATDALRVVKLDTDLINYKVGPIIARDDLEFISEFGSGSLYATSFDRNIYEVDVENLNVKSILYTANFKIRWALKLKHENKIFIQARDGTLIKYCFDQNLVLAEIKKMPKCIWSVCSNKEKFYFSGEGNKIYTLGSDMKFYQEIELKFVNLNSYTKRILLHNEQFYIGRSDGCLIKIDRFFNQVLLIKVKCAIRDIILNTDKDEIYIATEDNELIIYSEFQSVIIKRIKFEYPVWSLGMSPDCKRLTVGLRKNGLFLLNINDFSIIEKTNSKVPKRIRWINDFNFLVTNSSSISKFTLEQEEWTCYEDFFWGEENTIEDFVYHEKFNVVFAINYGRKLVAYDFKNGKKMCEVYNGNEFMKSVFIYDFEKCIVGVTGRGGKINFYILHNNNFILINSIEPKELNG